MFNIYMLFPTSGYLKLLWVHLSYVEYVAGKLLSDTSTTVGDKGLQLTTQCWGWGTETLPRTLKVKLLPWLFWKQDALHASHGANSVFRRSAELGTAPYTQCCAGDVLWEKCLGAEDFTDQAGMLNPQTPWTFETWFKKIQTAAPFFPNPILHPGDIGDSDLCQLLMEHSRGELVNSGPHNWAMDFISAGKGH